MKYGFLMLWFIVVVILLNRIVLPLLTEPSTIGNVVGIAIIFVIILITFNLPGLFKNIDNEEKD